MYNNVNEQRDELTKIFIDIIKNKPHRYGDFCDTKPYEKALFLIYMTDPEHYQELWLRDATVRRHYAYLAPYFLRLEYDYWVSFYGHEYMVENFKNLPRFANFEFPPSY